MIIKIARMLAPVPVITLIIAFNFCSAKVVQDQEALNDLRSTFLLALNKLQKALPVEDGSH